MLRPLFHPSSTPFIENSALRTRLTSKPSVIPESEFESSGLVVDDLPAAPASASEVAVSNADVVGDAHVVLVTEVGAVEIETEASVLKPSEVHEERSGSQTDSGVGSLDSVGAGAGAGVGMAGSLNAGPDDRSLSSSSVSPLKSRFGSFRDVGSFLFSPFTVI